MNRVYEPSADLQSRSEIKSDWIRMVMRSLYHRSVFNTLYSTNPYKVVVFNINEERAEYVYSTEDNKSYYLCSNYLVVADVSSEYTI